MKSGSVLIESIVFLLLSFLLFVMVTIGVDELTQREKIIELGTQDLSFLISLSNVSAVAENIPLDLKKKMITYQSTDGRIWYEYTCKSNGKRIFLPVGIGHNSSGTSGFNGDLHDRLNDSF